MGLVFELMLVLAIVGSWAVVLFVFLAMLVTGFVWPSRALKWIGAIGSAALVLLGVFVVGWVIWVSMTSTPQAADIVQLPPEAVVVKVYQGTYAGDGHVVFLMPATKSPDQWVAEIWATNEPADARQPGVKLTIDRPYHKQFDPGEGVYDLEYDRQTKRYRFEVDIED